MNSARFLITLAGFGLLTFGLSLAAEPSPPPPARGPAKVRLAQGHVAPAGPRLNEALGPNPLGNEPHLPALGKVPSAPINGFVINNAAPLRQPLAGLPRDARPLAGTKTAASLPGGLRSHAPATASLGGLAASSAKGSAAALSGTGMKPKP